MLSGKQTQTLKRIHICVGPLFLSVSQSERKANSQHHRRMKLLLTFDRVLELKPQ